jgi:hypothetical protein
MPDRALSQDSTSIPMGAIARIYLLKCEIRAQGTASALCACEISSAL